MTVKNTYDKGGFVLHEGDDFIVVVTMRSSNRKTGDTPQIWIMERDKSPVDSVKFGSDAHTVCKGCPFASGNGCYVNVGQAPLAVWKSYHAGKYPYLPVEMYDLAFKNRVVRFGAYGNPSLIPLYKVEAIAEAATAWTGYFHDWEDMVESDQQAYGQYFMASTETEESRMNAAALGLRYFHVSPDKPEEARECLADTHNLTCEQCRLCMGNSKSRQRSIWINPHGSKKAKAVQVARGVTQGVK